MKGKMNKYLAKQNRYLQGFYNLKHPKKYIGNPKNVVFRSSFEMQFMRMIDESENIIKWASEEMPIPYFDPISNRMRRYFVDFMIEQKNKDESISKIMVEIKPMNQIIQPKKTPRKKMETYMNEMMEYTRNRAKWEAAKKWCEKHNFKFMIVTKNEQNRFALLTEEMLNL